MDVMEIISAIVLIISGSYVGWNIGANDAANCIGTAVGAGIITFRRAAIIMAIFAILGAALQGRYVMETIGKGIIITSFKTYEEVHNKPPPENLANYFPDEKLPDAAVFVALTSAGFFVTLATFYGMPVSTSQSVVGGVAGLGLGIVGFQATYFQLMVLVRILACWVICPILTMTFAFGIYIFVTCLLRKAKAAYRWNRLLILLVIGSGCYVSYSLGANDVGTAIGLLLNKYPEKGIHLALLGGISIGTGALTFGRRVTESVGKNITPLDLPGAFAAQFATAIGVHLFSVLGMPVSTSQAIIGAVIGVGLTKGTRAVSRRKITEICVGWVLAPSCAVIFSAVVYRIVSAILSQ
ncbi:MAG: inorganic phosphate transporter [Deltaproteobacteria bacterium]|nr:MAG: inorganic phosphate transporter [Deltaproteobacteria bacterium]